MSDILVKPIGFVNNERIQPIDDNWSSVESIIELADDLPVECFEGIEEFAHLEVIDEMINRAEQTDGRCFETFRRINVFAKKQQK